MGFSNPFKITRPAGGKIPRLMWMICPFFYGYNFVNMLDWDGACLHYLCFLTDIVTGK